MQMMDEWRTPSFRQNMISKIEEAIQQCGASMNASDLEGQLFTKSRHKEEYMSLVTRIIMHIKDKGSKKHGVGGGGMGQPNQPPGNQMGGPMGGGQGQMGMMNQMNPMQQMNQMGVNVMGQQGMVHQMQQPQLVQQMQGPGGQMIGGIPQQQANQQSQQQHQIGQQAQAQMMGQNQIALGMNQGQIPVSQMQHMQNAQMGNPQMQSQVQQMQNVQQQMQQSLMQGNSQQIQMMQQGGQQQVMMQQGNQPQQGMMQGGGQPQMMSQQQQQSMMQASSQAQQQMQSNQQQQQQQQMMQGGPQQQQQAQQQQAMMAGPGGPQQGPQVATSQQQQQMMQVRGIPNPQMVGNRLMSPQPNVSNTLTALAHAQQQRKAQQRPMVPPNAMGIPRPEHGPNYSMNRLYYGSNMAQVDNVPVNVQFQGVPGGNQMQQRPVGPFVQSSTAQGMPSPSPGSVQGQMSQQQSTFVNSPGSQNMMHRPPGPGVNVSGHSPFPNQMVNVPSPNTNLNTPMPMAPTPSPRNAEDQACFEKIKELKKYTDLLQRMIAKAGNEDMEKSSKMKKLLEILTNPNQRVSMEILLKCEVALKKMERQQHVDGGVLAPSSVSAPTPQPIDQKSPFQQIQDAVMLALKNGSSSHTFLRTFRQSVEALTGQPFATSPDHAEPEPENYSDNELSVELPGVLRRELKIVDSRFKVRVIRNPRSALSIVLHVSLMESRLPRVPPLKIFIPHDYPDESPSVLDLRADYGGTGFLTSVARTLKSRLLNLPQRFTMLELLRCWEMSVRQVSNPHYKATAETRRRVSTSLAQAFL